MPKSLVPLGISSPGFYGLNKQRSGSILPPGWSTVLDNFVFDDVGRLSSRKGYRNLHATAISGSPDVKAIHEYIDGTGNRITIFAAGNAIYSHVGGTITDISGTITTPTDDNWKFQNFNGRTVGFQTDHDPIEILTTSGSFTDITFSGTQQPTTSTNEVLSAYGRLWAIDGTDLKYSDLLDQTAWNGVFDLSLYWKGGMDEGVALADFNGYLIVFGRENIIIYDNPHSAIDIVDGTAAYTDPENTMTIVESIGGVGCIARDSVQVIGKDVLFLSKSGIKSLGRVIQEKSMPMQDVSIHVRDDLLNQFGESTANDIKSVHNVDDGLYILSFPGAGSSYCFDTKSPLEGGGLRATTWTIAPTAMYYSVEEGTYFGTAGYLAKYDLYLDGILSTGSGGDTYDLDYEGIWNDFGEEVASMLKIPKKCSLLMAGVAGRTVAIKWAFDYTDSFDTGTITFPSGNIAQYGIAQYGIDTYSGELDFDRANTPMTKTGQVLKFGIQTTVNAQQIAIQRIDVLVKVGRLSI